MTPAPVDHDERRARLTEVLLDVVAEAGLEAATVRTVADRAGVSIGTVQHYFKTKDDMLRHAYRTVGKELGDRAEARAEGATSWKEAIREILLELLPLDERRAAGYRVSVAFAARATWNAELGAELRKDLVELQTIFVDMLQQAGVANAEREATTLLALNAGLAEPLIYGDGSAKQVVEALDAYLDRLF
ncbi:TetR/AcrR family transcriptional regulator [Solirubrobacter phytolaccae]|uniref:TetR/AcrR family transcriptional regulator n=1 Tax=Solirubrobacter phytolaccae TaxID=1404360 RepID=A0A9X3NG88_9ACTN|nr:TetR/AcrR family transcriptional regulator [Solirubrobacter phytolaccae]MDA0183491.1 TetR/AcrR family transcriptional regulator [Solirubrobacter phytolaccae]